MRREDRCLITMNRDDLIARPEAPPRLDVSHGAHMIAPLDLKAGGTWIGLNRHGLVACLLNRHDRAAPLDGLSRGLIVPEALLGRDVAMAFDRVTGLDLSRFAPFTCVIVSRAAQMRIDWTGRELSSLELCAEAFWMTTSSSVSEREVAAKRRGLFDQLVRPSADSQSALIDFHTSSQPQEAWWSPWMTREHAHTKSMTQICLTHHENHLHYWDRAHVEAHGHTPPQYRFVAMPAAQVAV